MSQRNAVGCLAEGVERSIFRKLEHFFRCEGLAFMHFSFQFFYHNVLYKKSGVTKKPMGIRMDVDEVPSSLRFYG